ncbi:MAG: glutamate--cysteine ligase [Melioribacteraceae bacterium]|nr:MAG: glutamate--cysteine ligase [Melioribacteraceae bacterium]
MSVLHIYEGFGIELEYMIVDRDTLKAKPISDEILKVVTGAYNSDYDNGNISWSNELVLHVIEIKTNGPRNKLCGLENDFLININEITEILKNFNAKLLPTGAHPLFIPRDETKLWPHENNPVYDAYNRIFNCDGHGWSNLQSTHINLPFANDDEFYRLHTAIRCVLPIIPALTASTPLIEGKNTGIIDTRLDFYKNNQKKILSLAGDVIPELITSKGEYQNKIFSRIFADIEKYDTDDILKNEWLNSRGAIARFDRNAIEIRIIDLQESPIADVSLAALIIEVIHLISEDPQMLASAATLSQKELVSILNSTIKYGEQVVITNEDYLSLFEMKSEIKAGELWAILLENIGQNPIFMSEAQLKTAKEIIKRGTLSSRIITAIKNDYSMQNIKSVYQRLSACLLNNEIFHP